jgi:aldehyde dehydrogenase (NAD+)/phenylacetaldehyde dehydrogenase
LILHNRKERLMSVSEVSMIIGGREMPARSGHYLEIVNPANEEVEALAPEAALADVDLAVTAARKSFEVGSWRQINPFERGKLLYRLAELVDKHADELAGLDTGDMGKPYHHSRHHDVPGVVDVLRFYAGFSDKIRGCEIPTSPDKHVYTVREPVGVVACILPWNFPLASAAQKLGPALACGNTVVMKPAEQSPRSAVRLAELSLEAGFPPGVVNVITGRGETVGAALAGHPGVNKISFTGSTDVGRSVMRAAADNLSKITLELGGKGANIVFADALVESAVSAALLTSCYNTGQVCTSGSRLLLDRRIHDVFMEKLVAGMKSLKVGDPMQPDTKMGPLASREQLAKVRAYLEAGERRYQPIVCGRRTEPLERGYYVNPTIFDHVDPAFSIAQEEIFGPVLSVIDFEDEAQAVRIANQTTYGLGTAIWTSNIGRAHRFAALADTAFVWINCTNFWTPAIPYEGHRSSGLGVDMGIEAVESYTRLKSVVVQLSDAPAGWAREAQQ